MSEIDDSNAAEERAAILCNEFYLSRGFMEGPDWEYEVSEDERQGWRGLEKTLSKLRTAAEQAARLAAFAEAAEWCEMREGASRETQRACIRSEWPDVAVRHGENAASYGEAAAHFRRLAEGGDE